MSPRRRRAALVTDLRPSEQAALLARLAQRRDAVGEAVRDEIERLVAVVDPDEIAADVQLTLEFLDVETLWARAGEHRHGYTAPHEAAWEALEEALAPFVGRLGWYHAAGRLDAYDDYALGVLRGLYDFHHDSDTEWKAWAPDDPREAFGQVLDTWERHRDGPTERQAMRVRLATWCPGWERDVNLGS